MGELKDTSSGDRLRILVTGANGQLGKELRDLAPLHTQDEFFFLSREDMPIHHFELVRNYFNTLKPDYCINCAAYTAVDRAEEEKDKAYQINGEAVGVLAAGCKEHHTKFIHISTDYVFDGTASTPYTENFPPHPQSVYGASKLEGERQSLQLNPDCIIIRTSWVYSVHGKNFVKTMMRLMKEKNEISVVNDQVGSPTYAADLAEAILQIISSGKWQPGLYHYSNEGVISWYDFAVAIKELTNSNCKVNPIPSSQYPTPAKRPAYSVLDKTKFVKSFGIPVKEWKHSLVTCLSRLK
jgi:dTDP-4-dehydrorhamnose reductase